MHDKFEDSFPKLSKANSFSSGGLLFYVKKFQGSYVVWEYKTKIKIVSTDSKVRAIEYVNERIDELIRRMNELDI